MTQIHPGQTRCWFIQIEHDIPSSHSPFPNFQSPPYKKLQKLSFSLGAIYKSHHSKKFNPKKTSNFPPYNRRANQLTPPPESKTASHRDDATNKALKSWPVGPRQIPLLGEVCKKKFAKVIFGWWWWWWFYISAEEVNFGTSPLRSVKHRIL